MGHFHASAPSRPSRPGLNSAIGLLVSLWIGSMVASGCRMPSAANCRTDSDCGPEAICVSGGGVVAASGGRCVDESALDGGADADAGPETDIGCGGDVRCPDDPCEGEPCGAPTCDDGFQNGEETDIDCGGPDCEPCAPDQSCRENDDCETGNCAPSGRCAQPNCADGARNGEETDVDCGGPTCEPCRIGEACETDRDCGTAGFCDVSAAGDDRTCRSSGCDNGRHDPSETDVDCGGVCGPCSVGDSCDGDDVCQSGVCDEGVCVSPSCGDGTTNGTETDVDCGGECPACGQAQACDADRDCRSGRCSRCDEPDADDCDGEKLCRPSCDDGIKNQKETDVDCGGASCAGCSIGEDCFSGADCESGYCFTESDEQDDWVCREQIVGALTAGDPGRWSDGTYAASCDGYENPPDSAYVRTYRDLDLSQSDVNRNGIYEIRPPGANEPYRVYCQMLRHNARGGWTLALISADDGQATWTWSDRHLLTTQDTTTFGSPDERGMDYKSPAFHELDFEDLLFVYRDGGGGLKWLAYDEVGGGDTSVAEFVENQGETCYTTTSGNNVEPGYAKDAGNVVAEENLCSTDLYISPRDQNGGDDCAPTNGDNEHGFGPAWSVRANNTCPMDDPGEESSFGPNAQVVEEEADGRGFAGGLGDRPERDRIEMYIR